jgi:hypothetical protein
MGTDDSEDMNRTVSQYDNGNIMMTLNYTRCAGINARGSKFCSKCGFALTSVLLIFDSSGHVEERVIQDP